MFIKYFGGTYWDDHLFFLLYFLFNICTLPCGDRIHSQTSYMCQQAPNTYLQPRLLFQTPDPGELPVDISPWMSNDISNSIQLFQIPPNLFYMQLSLYQVRTTSSSQFSGQKICVICDVSLSHFYTQCIRKSCSFYLQNALELTTFITTTASNLVRATILSHLHYWWSCVCSWLSTVYSQQDTQSQAL